MSRLIGYNYTFSQRAILCTLVGGPYDGNQVLLDAPEYSFGISDSARKISYDYGQPKKNGVCWELHLVKLHYWDSYYKQPEPHIILGYN